MPKTTISSNPVSVKHPFLFVVIIFNALLSVFSVINWFSTQSKSAAIVNVFLILSIFAYLLLSKNIKRVILVLKIMFVLTLLSLLYALVGLNSLGLLINVIELSLIFIAIQYLRGKKIPLI